MGLGPNHVRMLLAARARGVSFGQTLTLGRQHWCLSAREQLKIAADFDLRNPEAIPYGGFADRFFSHWLGSEATAALDYSDFEGASLLHDLNQPVPEEMKGKYDALIDTGALEHIFNFPVALRNCLDMIRIGGRFFWSFPVNNHCGHGFYQFSPELAYRALSAERGFRIIKLLLVMHPFPGAELSPSAKYYRVIDPARAGSRVYISNARPMLMYVEAKKEVGGLPSVHDPQQSDYALAWSRGTHASRTPDSSGWAMGAALRLADRMPLRARNWLAGMYQRHYQCALRNRRLYRRVRDISAYWLDSRFDEMT